MTQRWISTRVVYGPDGRKLIDDGFWYDGPIAQAAAMAAWQQSHFALYEDGTESGAVIIGTADNQQQLDVDTIYIARLQVDETGGADGDIKSITWLYNINGSGDVTLTTTSLAVQAVDSANLTDGADTTQRLGLGSPGAFITTNAWVDEDGSIANLSYLAGETCETIVAFKIIGSQVSHQDNILMAISDGASANPVDIDVKKVAPEGRRRSNVT